MARITRLLAIVLFVSGLAIRATVRDRYDGWSIVYYATPWPVLAAVAVAAAIASAHRKARLTWGISSFACAVAWLGFSWVNSPASAEPSQLRVVSWNAEHPKRRLPEVIAIARAFEADLLGITETESTAPADAEKWRSAFPGFNVRTLPGFMLFITRGEILSTSRASLADRGRVNVVDIRINNRPLTVFFVEFNANPLRSRRPAFQALEKILDEHVQASAIVMGDFNTPLDSVHFAGLRSRMAHTFETAGHGLSETWPIPAPVLALDHIWATPSLRALRCSHAWEPISDHRAVIAEFAW
jgi:endonuclease/exonuclease/phosphatase (EEP) superfamily protein YafD